MLEEPVIQLMVNKIANIRLHRLDSLTTDRNLMIFGWGRFETKWKKLHPDNTVLWKETKVGIIFLITDLLPVLQV